MRNCASTNQLPEPSSLARYWLHAGLTHAHWCDLLGEAKELLQVEPHGADVAEPRGPSRAWAPWGGFPACEAASPVCVRCRGGTSGQWVLCASTPHCRSPLSPAESWFCLRTSHRPASLSALLQLGP